MGTPVYPTQHTSPPAEDWGVTNIASSPSNVDRPRVEDDMWRHRSAGMKCSSCMWFAIKVAEGNTPASLGRCRRHAPTMAGFPAVFTADWCGDHKLDENKLLR